MDYLESTNCNNYTSIRLLDHYETSKLESVDTLVYTSSLFIIPVNFAAINGKFLLMNMYIFLALTSWAHHACRHMKVKNHCIYDELDKFACVTLYVFLIFYTLFYKSFREFVITIIGLVIIAYCFYIVTRNHRRAINNRGIKNWKYQKPHIAMHFAAMLIGAYVAII